MDTLAHSIPEGLHSVVTLVVDLCGNIFGTNSANFADGEGARKKVRVDNVCRMPFIGLVLCSIQPDFMALLALQSRLVLAT